MSPDQLMAPAPGDLLVDCHGVLLDYFGGLAAFANHQFGLCVDTSGPKTSDLKSWLGVPRDEDADLVVERFDAGHSDEFVNMPILPGAREALVMFKEQGRKVHVISACANDAEAIRLRNLALMNGFGDLLDSIQCIGLYKSKLPCLQVFQPGIWVEDKLKHAAAGARCGHTSFLIRTGRNLAEETTHPDAGLVHWVSGWSEIAAQAG